MTPPSSTSSLATWLHAPPILITLLCAIPLIFSQLLSPIQVFDDPKSYLPLHTSLESFSIVVSVLIFAVTWHTREKHHNGRNLFLSCCFLGVAALDYFHTLSFPGMPDLITPSSTEKAIDFWLAARVLAALALLGTVLWAWQRLAEPIWNYCLLLLVTMLVFAVFWAQTFHPEIFPRTFIADQGLTPFKVHTEYLISATTLVAAGLMFHKSERGKSDYWVYLGCAALMMMFSELSFTLYADVSDSYNLLGHVYKVVAYSLIYFAVFVVSVREPYRQLQKSQLEQKKIADQLLVSQNIASLGYWTLDFPSSQLTWSESVFQLFEIDPSEFDNTYEAFLNLIHPEDREKVNDNFNTSLKGHTPYDFVHRLLMKDARVKWVREMGVTEYDAQDEPLRTNGVIMDITSIVQMTAAMRSSELRYRTITESLPVPLLIHDAADNITYLNPSFVSTFGYRREDVVDMEHWFQQAFPDASDRNSVIQRLHPDTDGTPQSADDGAFDTQLICQNGEVRIMTIKQSLLENNEHLLFFYDLTDRKKAEQAAIELREQLAQTSKMEAVGQLAAGIAHDFNNMLGAIAGYTELARQKNNDKDELIERYLAQVVKATDRAKQLISQMLTFSRRSMDAEDREAPALLIHTVCKEVVSLLHSSIPSAIEVNYQVEDKGFKSRIHPVNLHQILLNLAVNARDAMGEYGKLDILLSRAHVDYALCACCHQPFDGDFIRICVRDTGSGIPAAVLEKMFDPFFTTKEVGKGTGMGLSVVHGIVHSTGGHLLVESEEGKGTSIHLLLPLDTSGDTDQKVTPVPRQSQQSHALAGLRIMIVDDEEQISSMLQEFLSLYGAQLRSFQSSQQALDEFEKNPGAVDLVITDETMPGLSGMHLAERMLQRKPELPIILCTGYSEHAEPGSVAESGITAFFEKPVKLSELLEKVIQIRSAASL